MATILPILKSVQNNQAFIQQFLEDNMELGRIYSDDIRPYLAKRGWYIGGSLNPIQHVQLRDAIQNGKDDRIDSFFEQHVRARVDDIEHFVCKTWPRRAEIIKAAFEAHKERKYSLSIPTMLAQIDGICHSILEVHIFTKHNGDISEKVKELISSGEVNTPLAIAFLDLIMEPSSVMTNTKKRDERQKNDPDYGPINRHGILHGIDLDYSTETNGLRSIALISFLCWVNERI